MQIIEKKAKPLQPIFKKHVVITVFSKTYAFFITD